MPLFLSLFIVGNMIKCVLIPFTNVLVYDIPAHLLDIWEISWGISWLYPGDILGISREYYWSHGMSTQRARRTKSLGP